MCQAVPTLAALLVVGLIAIPARPCSRFLWNNNKLGVFVARTMDWPESTEPVITVFPRGMAHDGGKVGPDVVVKENPAKWTSKYGSMITSVYGIGTIDGFNEKGLGVHMLYLSATDFGPRDKTRPAVHAGLWGQYLLDNCATVKEALEALKGIQVVMAEARGHKATLHLASVSSSRFLSRRPYTGFSFERLDLSLGHGGATTAAHDQDRTIVHPGTGVSP